MPHPPDPADQAVGRRVAAARKAAGIDRRSELANLVQLPRLGAETLGRIERGERHLFPHEAEAIARALAVDASSFYAEPQPDTQLDRIERAMTANRDVFLAAAEAATEERKSIMRLLEAQQRILERMEAVAAGLPDDATLRALTAAAQELERAAEDDAADNGVPSEGEAGTGRRRA